MCIAHYTVLPKGISAGLFASAVPKKLAWQLLGVHLPCQWLMESTSRVFYYCLVPEGSLGVLFRSCCGAGTCLGAEMGALWGVKQRFKTKGWWGIGCACNSRSSSSESLRSPSLLRT